MSALLCNLLDQLTATQYELMQLRKHTDRENNEDTSTEEELKEQKQKNVQQILKFLEHFPYCLNGHGSEALGSFMKDDVGLEGIKALCSIQTGFSKHLQKRSDRYDPVFHLACRYCSNDVILFLLSLDPALNLHMETSGSYPKSPLFYALNNRNHVLSEHTLRTILDMHPLWVAKDSVLFEAFRHNYSLQFLEYMVDCWPKDEKKLEKYEGDYPSFHTTIDQTKVLWKLLPKLSIAELDFFHWGTQTFRWFLKALIANETVQTIHLAVWPSELKFDDENNGLLDLLCEVLSSNKALQQVTLQVIDDLKTEQPWIELIITGAQESQQLRSLVVLAANCFRENPREEIPHLVKLTRRTSTGYALSVQDFNLPGASCLACFQRAAQVQNLEWLTILPQPQFVSVSKEIFTTRVVETLNKHRDTLCTIDIGAYEVDGSMVLDALKTVSSLKAFSVHDCLNDPNELTEQAQRCLDFLTRGNNMTLQRFYPWSSYNERIGYYLALNKFGRGVARTGTDREWIEALADSQTRLSGQDYFYFPGYMDFDTMQRNILYGLVHERLPLLCNWKPVEQEELEASRKRKAVRELCVIQGELL